MIVVGEVKALHVGRDYADPLTHYGGQYKRLVPFEVIDGGSWLSLL
jgi:hypothetical protein